MGYEDLTDTLRIAFVGHDQKEGICEVLQLHGLNKFAAPFFPSQITSEYFSASHALLSLELGEPCLSSYYLWDYLLFSSYSLWPELLLQALTDCEHMVEMV